MSDIRLERVSKYYGSGDNRVTAVNAVNLLIKEGEFVSIMGESGAGKSTLLSMMGCLMRPSEGSIHIGDVDVLALSNSRLADFRREFMGFVFQSFQLVSFLTVAENVRLPLAVTAHSEREKRALALDALERVGLADKAERLPDQLSGGEQERVAIARAIVNNPPILFADEPTGNLDSRNSQRIMRLLEDLAAEGRTIVMVTHSQENASHAQRQIRVSDGRVFDDAEDGDCDNEVCELPTTRLHAA